AIIAAGLCGSVIFAGCVIAAVSRFDLIDVKNTYAQAIADRATTEICEGISDAVSAAGSTPDIARAREPWRPEATFAEIAVASMPDVVHADAGESLSPAEAPDESLPNPSRAPAPETRPVQIAAASADDVPHGDFNGVVGVESLRGSSRTVAVATPADGVETTS